jgi:hypothetical protein
MKNLFKTRCMFWNSNGFRDPKNHKVINDLSVFFALANNGVYKIT